MLGYHKHDIALLKCCTYQLELPHHTLTNCQGSWCSLVRTLYERCAHSHKH